MLKALIITPACHFRSVGAAQRDIYAGVTLMQKLGYQVALYTIDSLAQDKAALAVLSEKYGFAVKRYAPAHSRVGRLFRVLRALPLLDGSADGFAQLSSDQDFQKYVAEFNPSVVMSFCSYSWPVLAWAKRQGIATVLRSHNFEPSFFWEELEFGARLNPFNWLRVAAKYAGERRAARAADKIATLPFLGVRHYQRWRPGASEPVTLFFLPAVICPPAVHPEKRPLDIFYLGASYNVSFHRRGAAVLIERVAPRVLAAAPGAFRFHILGAKLPSTLAAQCVGNIVYEGYVPDLEAFLKNMDGGAFPVFTGRTMKGKVFESLARSFPLVIAPNCLGGYELKSDREVLIAAGVEEFARQIMRLQNDALRERLAANAYQFALANFSEPVVSESLKKCLPR